MMNSNIWIWAAYIGGFVLGISHACRFVNGAIAGQYQYAAFEGFLGIACLFVAIRASDYLYKDHLNAKFRS